MQLRRLGTTGTQVSELALGAMTFGREASEEQSIAMLDRYVAAGGNLVDTADVYGAGASEEIVGRWLRGRRNEIVLATKFRMPTGPGPNEGGASRRHLRRAVEASLRRLGTDRIDLYQVHCWDAATPLEETLSTLDDLVRAGTVLHVGASNYAGWHLATALGLQARHGWEPFVSLQPQYSLVTRDAERELLPLARSVGLAVLPWSPLGGGLLTGKYRPGEQPGPDVRAGDRTPSAQLMQARLQQARNHAVVEAVRSVADELGRSPAQVALNWLRGRDGVTAPILGARTPEQLADNLACVDWNLDPEHRRLLDEASAIELGYPHDFISWIHRR